VAGTDYLGATDLVQVMFSGLGWPATTPYRMGPAQGIQPDPLGIAANEVTNRIYVANRGNNTVTVIEDTEVIP
jgi:DNA-binding beta-propeller fold protein YncE